MSSQTIIDNPLRQLRMDALAAKYLHQMRLNTLRCCIRVVDVIAMIVPISFFPIRYLLKGSVIGAYAEIVWEVLASMLFALSLLRIVLRWQESAEKHNELLARNISLANDAEQMLDGRQLTSSGDVKYFFQLAKDIEVADRSVLGRVSDKERQRAYREGLKEFRAGEVTCCPVCNASPWSYVPGCCQVCGNTHQNIASHT